MPLPKFLEDLDPQIFWSDNYVVLDFEIDTSHGDYGSAVHEDNQMLLAMWSVGPDHPVSRKGAQGQFVKWGNEFELDQLILDIENADFLVAHHTKYELMWLKRAGLDLSKVLVFDTMLAEYVLMGNLAAGDAMMRGRSISLDACCRRRGFPAKDPVINIMMGHGINPVEMPRPWLQGRCDRDVTETEKLFLSQRLQLDRTNRLPVLFTRDILTPVLASVEFNGMCLDDDRVKEEHATYLKKYTELENLMEEVTGGINWRSPKQVGEYLYDILKFPEFRKPNGEPNRTAAGGRLTGKGWLDKLEAKTPAQKKFLEVKSEIGKVGSALSKNLDFFLGVVQEYGGIFHAEFNQAVTSTHRLSSSGIATYFDLFGKAKKVQFQNLPNAFKRLFRARRPGWKMAEADGSQLEFRVAGFSGKDQQVIDDITNHHDAHKFTGSVIFHAPKEWLKDIGSHIEELEELSDKVTKQERKKSKPHTFKPLYGGTSGTEREKAYYAAFKSRYRGLADTQDGWVREVLNRKQLITPWGMRYYWPFAKKSKSGYVNVGSAVFNYPIQALATAEIIPIAVTYFWHRVHMEGLQDVIVLVNSVHDSLICEVHPDHVGDFRRIAIQAFGVDVYNYLEKVYNLKFTVTLGAGIMIADHWADDTEGEEESYDIHVDGRVEEILPDKSVRLMEF